MENPNAGAGHGPEGSPRSGLLPISMSANVVLALLAVGLGIWGWSRHERTKELHQMVTAADQKVVQMVTDAEQKVAAAIQERDEAWENSRELQSRLVNAKGLMNAFSGEPAPNDGGGRFEDDDDASPP